MIFAPVARHSAFANAPRSADLALQRFLLGNFPSATPARSAGVTITQDDKSTSLQLDVPGLTREQLQIAIEGNVVRLSSIEGAPRQVQRAWELATEIDAATSSAKLENGVLTLTLVRVEPVSKATTLSIQ